MVKLRAKKFNWLAGRPVVVLNQKTAEKLDVHVDERVSLKFKHKKVYAVVDIFSKLVGKNQIGLSNEIASVLKTPQGSEIEVLSSELSPGGFLIKKKLMGKQLSNKEILNLVSEISQNNLTESEIAYFVSAEKMRGMTSKEVIFLTESMIKTGKRMNFNKKIVADKHCIGGIAGNRTTPIVVSICAVAGLAIPKSSSRAITSASGTADVIETISEIEFSLKKIKKIISKTNACIVWGGSLGLAPSDDKIIHVEKLLNLDVEPQLIASIMSKKISAGSNYLLIDIPYGKGSKIPNKKRARLLEKKFRKVAKYFKIKLKVVFTKGEQPIGNGIGPVLEMLDVLDVLQNKPGAPEDLKKKSIYLSSELLSLCNIKNSFQIAKNILESGKAYEKFRQIINTQNGESLNSNDFEKRVSKLKNAKFKKQIYSRKEGEIIHIDNKGINSLCRVLGAPESKSAGVYLNKHLEKVKKNEIIMTLYSESKSKLKDAVHFIKEFKPIILK